MRHATRYFILLMLASTVVITPACSEKNQPQQQPGATQSSNSNTASQVSAKKTQATGTITATPNPIKVCDGGGGVTKLTWSASGTNLVEVRIGSPDGGLFAHTAANGGTKETGKWVGNGTVVYLQDVSDGKPPTSEYTIATITLNVTKEGCP